MKESLANEVRASRATALRQSIDDSQSGIGDSAELWRLDIRAPARGGDDAKAGATPGRLFPKAGFKSQPVPGVAWGGTSHPTSASRGHRQGALVSR